MTEEQLMRRIEDLEYTVAKQDSFIDDLNKAISSQQDELLELKKQFEMMLKIMRDRQNDDGTTIENQPPPHYNQTF